MSEYIVRLWVDIHVEAKTPREAKAIAEHRDCKVTVEPQEIYDIQVADIWTRGGDKIMCTCIGSHKGIMCPFHGAIHTS